MNRRGAAPWHHTRCGVDGVTRTFSADEHGVEVRSAGRWYLVTWDQVVATAVAMAGLPARPRIDDAQRYADAAAREGAPLALDSYDLRRVADAAEVDPRSVARVLRGLPTHSRVRVHVLAALRQCGLGHLVPADPPPSGEQE